ncbi:MAG: hypothetical protein AB2L26_07340 [Ignavibacteria bacterium]
MKKLKFLVFSAAAMIITVLSLTEVISQSNPNLKDRSFLGPINHYFLNELRTDSHNNRYIQMAYNLMQNYCAHTDSFPREWTTQRDGGFFEDITNYSSFIDGVMRQWSNAVNLNSLIFEREKILRPAYGQRFTYQAEDVGTWQNKFPAYGYNYSDYNASHDVDDPLYSGVRSKLCRAGIDPPGFMVKSLYENCSQTNNLKRVSDSANSSGWERLYSDIKERKYNMRWFIKPKMRAQPNDIYSHLNDTIIKIYVQNFRSDIIDSFAIKGINFLDSNSSYDGRYLENFYGLPANYLSVSTDSLAVGRTDGDTLTFHSNVDYMIKWNGKVDVWLDYVRVDDSWAHYLFTDTYENEILPGNQNPWKFHWRIKEEVDAFKRTPGLAYFWVDEVQYPNLECIGEVNRLVREYSNNQLSLLFITDPIAFMGWPGFRHKDETVPAYWDACIDSAVSWGALKDIMITQWFPMYYNKKFPDILSVPNRDSFPLTQYFNQAVSYNDYTYESNYGVQPAISWLVRQHKYYIAKAKSKGLIYGVINQINSDENNIHNGNVD